MTLTKKDQEKRAAHIQKMNTLSRPTKNGKLWKAKTGKNHHTLSSLSRNQFNAKNTSKSWSEKQKAKQDKISLRAARDELKNINDQEKKDKRMKMEEKKRKREENELKNQLAQNGGSTKSQQQNARLAKRLKRQSERRARLMEKKQKQML